MSGSPTSVPIPAQGVPAVPGYDTSGTSLIPGTSSSSPNGIRVGNYTITLVDTNPNDPVPIAGGGDMLAAAGAQNSDTVQNQIEAFQGWSTTQFIQFRQQAYQMGLTSTANASKAEVLTAWQAVVEEASKEKLPTDVIIQEASNGGWNTLNPQIAAADLGLSGTGNSYSSPNQSQSQTQTTYVSYMDPATVQGTLADSMYRLLGRMPTQQEYQDYLNMVYKYEDEANTGKFEDSTTNKSGSTKAPGGSSTDVQQNIVSQRGIGTRGAEFLAGQTAMADPDYGQYQAATTYFNAFMKALAGPAAGMQAAGPTVTSP